FRNTVNETLEGEIIVRAVDDDDFEDRSMAALESDIINTEADFVIIDPFYYMDYERNTSKTTGGDATNTSNKLRRLAGKTETVIIARSEERRVGKECRCRWARRQKNTKKKTRKKRKRSNKTSS